MTTTNTRPREKHIAKKGVWGWLLDSTFGNSWRLFKWSLIAIGVSILVEWAGMIWFWGPDHSREILELEMSYLGEFNKNLLTGLRPEDLGGNFVSFASTVVGFLHLREISNLLADDVMSGARTIALYGIDSMINTIFIFAVRAAICVSAISGFVLVGIVAFLDGLVERDIRKACGGIESAMLYHRAKRMLAPLLFLSFGGYLTAPISIHPTIVFLPVMALFGFSLYMAAKTFKKFL